MLPEDLPHYPAPAKLNLDLRIIGRRPNGYHELESIFTLIDWCDTLCIRARDDGEICLKTPLPNVPPECDLTVRAAKILQPYALSSLKNGADIWLQKNIPMGGGLGGGSSDAATVLMVLNRLWQCDLPVEKLMQLAQPLGADIPFFLFGQSAFARGVGERLTPMSVPLQWYVIAQPDVSVSTPKIFAHPDLVRDSQPCAHADFVHLQPFRNDMQAVVFKEYPLIKQTFDIMKSLGEPLMTGSGACLFLRFDNPIDAREAVKKLPEDIKITLVQGLAHHPLREKFLLK